MHPKIVASLFWIPRFLSGSIWTCTSITTSWQECSELTPSLIVTSQLRKRFFASRVIDSVSSVHLLIYVVIQVYNEAIKAVDSIFFVGIQEAYDFSVELLLREFDMKLSIELPKERQDSSKKLKENKDKVKSDKGLMKKAEDVNYYDMMLYRYGMLLQILTLTWWN